MIRYRCSVVFFIAATMITVIPAPVQVQAAEPSYAQVEEAKRRIDQNPTEARKELAAHPEILNRMSPAQREEVMQYIQAAEQRQQKQTAPAVQVAPQPVQGEVSVPSVAPEPSVTAPITVPATPPAPATVSPPPPEIRSGPNDIYGRNLFREEFLNPQYVEIPDGYVIAPGDEVLLRFWGSFNQERKYLIGDDGYVFIEPLKRQAYLIGMTFGNLRDMIQRVSDASPGVQGDVRIVKAHPIFVHITGAAANPGTVSAPAHYTFWQFLMLTKGPSDNGSVRDIRVTRRGRDVARVDIYDFMRFGRKPIITLQNEDLIFFGEAKKIVRIEHFVKKPGVYELKEGEKLGDLVSLAGGFVSGIFAPRIQIQRTVDISEKSASGYPYVVIDIDLMRKGWEKTELKDGDKVLARTMAPRFANDLYIEGKGIAVPGRYSLPKKTWTADDLVREAGGLVPGASRNAELMRLNPDRVTRTTIPLDIFDNASLQRIYLQALDSIVTWHDAEFVDRGNIRTSGFVRRQIDEPYSNSLTLWDMLRKSEGLKPGAHRTGELLRLNADRKTRTIIPVDLFDTAAMQAMRIEPFDNLITYHDSEFVDIWTVKSRGFVRNPIEERYTDSLTLADVIRKSLDLREGGLPYVYVKRTDSLDRVTYHRFSIADSAAAAAVKLDKRDDVLFFDYRAFNRKLPVTVLAYNSEPLILSYSPDLTLAVVIHELGGIDPLIDSSHVEICIPDFKDASLYATVITDTLNSRTVSQRGLIPEGGIVIFRKDPNKEIGSYVTISGEVLRPGRYPLLRRDSRLAEVFKAAGGLTPRANKWAITIARDGKTVPVEVGGGRLSFVSNWVLNGNDAISVGRNDYAVEVAGAVFDPRVVAYHPGYSWKDYVKKGGGGPLDTADMKRTYVQYPNGVTMKARSGWFIFSSSADMKPGCRVVVPMKPFVLPPKECDNDKTDYSKLISVTSSSILAILAIFVMVDRLK